MDILNYEGNKKQRLLLLYNPSLHRYIVKYYHIVGSIYMQTPQSIHSFTILLGSTGRIISVLKVLQLEENLPAGDTRPPG